MRELVWETRNGNRQSVYVDSHKSPTYGAYRCISGDNCVFYFVDKKLGTVRRGKQFTKTISSPRYLGQLVSMESV